MKSAIGSALLGACTVLACACNGEQKVVWQAVDAWSQAAGEGPTYCGLLAEACTRKLHRQL